MANNVTCFFPDTFYFPCYSICDGTVKSTSSHFIVLASTIVIVALAPVAVVGNSLVLAAIWKKTFERTSFHILLSALALTDLLSGLISQPFICLPYVLTFVNPIGFIGQEELIKTLAAIGISSGVYVSSSTIFILTFMSVERWLHMTRRSLMTPQRRCFVITALLLLPILPGVFTAMNVLEEVRAEHVRIFLAVLMLLNYLITSFAYVKVFRIIRQHQQQVVEGNRSSQNVAQPAINVAKYNRTMVTIFYILALFSISLLPMIVSLAVITYKGLNLETAAAYYVCLVLFFSPSFLNPILYLWRMNDIRNGVKRLLCTNG